MDLQCTDLEIDKILDILEEIDFKKYVRMIEEEGVDTKEYYYKLKNMDWRVEMVGVKPDGNGIFIKTILLYLKSSDFRFIAVLIGVDLTSITQSTIQLECNYDRKYIVVKYYRDSSLCRT